MAGASRLDQIRASMAGGQLGSGQSAPAVDATPAASTNGSLPLAEQRLAELRRETDASSSRPPA
jgi:hypothetical protein